MSETIYGGGSESIVVGVDGSEPANAALRWAVKQAELTGDTVLAVIAWQYPISGGGYGWAPVPMDDGTDLQSIAEKTLAEAINKVVRPGSKVQITRRVVEGYAPTVLVHESEHAKLLVVGNRGHGTFADVLLGSVSQNCAHHAKCPVVIVRGEKQ
jgi:nucleotide-binding universal stress UspA family protein